MYRVNLSNCNIADISFRSSEDRWTVFVEGTQELLDGSPMRSHFCTKIPLLGGERIKYINSKLKPNGALYFAISTEKSEEPNKSPTSQIVDVQNWDNFVDRRPCNEFKLKMTGPAFVEILPDEERRMPCFLVDGFVHRKLQRGDLKNSALIKAHTVMRLKVMPRGLCIDPGFLPVLIYAGVEKIRKALHNIIISIMEDLPERIQVVNNIDCFILGIPNIILENPKPKQKSKEAGIESIHGAVDAIKIWAILKEITKQIEEDERNKKKKRKRSVELFSRCFN